MAQAEWLQERQPVSKKKGKHGRQLHGGHQCSYTELGSSACSPALEEGKAAGSGLSTLCSTLSSLPTPETPLIPWAEAMAPEGRGAVFCPWADLLKNTWHPELGITLY